MTDTRFEQWHRWVAQYNIQCDYTGTYAMWQYSSKELVDGIDGLVDMNYLIGTPADHGVKELQGRSFLTKLTYRISGGKLLSRTEKWQEQPVKNKGIEALKMQLNDVDGDIEYRAHVRDIGWQDYVSNGQQAGTTGQAKTSRSGIYPTYRKSGKNNMISTIEYIQVILDGLVGQRMGKMPEHKAMQRK